MNTEFYRKHSLLRIFISYFKPHRRLFLLDMLCAVLVAAIDLAFPIISRTAMKELLPQHAYGVFFTIMAILAAAYLLRAGLYYVITYQADDALAQLHRAADGVEPDDVDAGREPEQIGQRRGEDEAVKAVEEHRHERLAAGADREIAGVGEAVEGHGAGRDEQQLRRRRSGRSAWRS